MPLYKTNCIILRCRNLGEADRVLTVFSEDRGKFEAAVKGARRPRSRFVGNTLPFNYLKAMFLSGKSLDSLSQAELVHSFAALREDLIKMPYATFWAELVDGFLPEKVESKEIFLFLLAAFVTLEKTAEPGLLHLAFEARLLNALGYQPELESCLSCGRPIEGLPLDGAAYFSVAAGGVLCEDCRGAGVNLIPIPRATLTQMIQLGITDLRELAGLAVQTAERRLAERILRDFIEFRLERPLKSQAFLDSCLQS